MLGKLASNSHWVFIDISFNCIIYVWKMDSIPFCSFSGSFKYSKSNKFKKIFSLNRRWTLLGFKINEFYLFYANIWKHIEIELNQTRILKLVKVFNYSKSFNSWIRFKLNRILMISLNLSNFECQACLIFTPMPF